MSEESARTPFSPSVLLKETIYTKLQVHFGGDIQEIVLKTEKQPTCRDLSKVLEETFRIPADNQLVYYRGQRLHHRHSKSVDRLLSRYGIFSGSLISLIGKRGLL